MNNFFKTLILAAVLAYLAPTGHAQTATPSTTLCAAATSTARTVCLTSSTGVVDQTGIYVDLEYMTVVLSNGQTLPATNAVVPVRRGTRSGFGPPAAHASGQTAWIALTPSLSVVPGANGFGFGTNGGDYGTCTRAAVTYLPHIWPDRGVIRDCNAATGLWVDYVGERTVMIGPGSCGWSTTGTYNAQVAVATGGPNLQGLTVSGTSGVPVNVVSVTNAGASVNTLTCYLSIDTFQPLLGKGVTITSVDVLYGVATTTLTSISGGAFSTITFPAPGATETASTVTPVAVGGSVTTSSTTGNMAATTAGAFKVSRLTPATAINLTTDMQALLISENFNQSASAAQIVLSPGMLVHYTYMSQ